MVRQLRWVELLLLLLEHSSHQLKFKLWDKIACVQIPVLPLIGYSNFKEINEHFCAPVFPSAKWGLSEKHLMCQALYQVIDR